MSKITIITEVSDLNAIVRYEYEGVLIGDTHAVYVDPAYSLVVFERVRLQNGQYYTTGGAGAIIFDLNVPDTSFVARIAEMSAVELLKSLINGGN